MQPTKVTTEIIQSFVLLMRVRSRDPYALFLEPAYLVLLFAWDTDAQREEEAP